MPTNNVQALLAQDIHDPTDFSETHLRQLDAGFRCTICGEFFDAPISLTCGHCFCSLCVREHLTREQECPTCRKPASEAHFRVNTVLEEVVSAWKTARSTVLDLSRQRPPKAFNDRKMTDDKIPRRFHTPVRNGRKRRHTEVSYSSDSDIVCIAGPSNPKESGEITDSSPLQAKCARKASRQRSSMVLSSDPREEEFSSIQPDSLVDCPVCGDSVEFQLINVHMDGSDCGASKRSKPSNPNARNEWSKILGGKSERGESRRSSGPGDTMERLPKASYGVLKDKALKELLSSQHLPTNGDRNTRIARHRRWVMMYNANLDKTMGRKTLPELHLELQTWEEVQRGRKRIVVDTAAHETLHKEEFGRLTAEARQRRFRPPTPCDAPQG